MKKEKGFTLIELLAVIVILAILMVVAVPKILNVIENSRKSAATSSAKLYIDAINKNNTLSKVDNQYKNITDGVNKNVKFLDVKIKGDKPTSGFVTIKKGKVISSNLCINGYHINYSNLKYDIVGDCSKEEIGIDDIASNSILEYVKQNNIENDNNINIKVSNESYSIHTYNYDNNQVWSSDMVFGNENDVATEKENAKNMVLVKINGDLTINEGVNVSAYSSKDGYGGPKGLLIYVTGTLTNNGTISMTSRGAKAEGQNVYLFQNLDGSYEYVPKDGGAGGEAVTSNVILNGNNGSNGENRKTGGGGSGALNIQRSGAPSKTSGAGSNGTSYSGGSGGASIFGNVSGIADPASPNGGKGGNASINSSYSGYIMGGGAGNPGGFGKIGSTYNSIYDGENGTGGLLIIYSNNFVNNGQIESNGSQGGGDQSSYAVGGAGSGAGSINIFYNNNYSSLGSIIAKGGLSGSGKNSAGSISGTGGSGSITIGSIKDDSFKVNPRLLCQQATVLHSSGSTTFGNIRSGKLKSGDAFDCDVNGDGVYDENTERFYYLMDIDENNSSLIYYNNVIKGIANNQKNGIAYYDKSNENYHGPETAIKELPTTSQWSKVNLKNNVRTILNENGESIVTGGVKLPSNFSYDGYAARLLTVQEINTACNIKVGSLITGELNNCNYLLENTGAFSGSINGYWIENPVSSSSTSAWFVHSYYKRIGNHVNVAYAYDLGVRPVIEVPKAVLYQ